MGKPRHKEAPGPAASSDHLSKQAPNSGGGLLYFAVLALLYSVAVGLSLHRLWSVPVPLAASESALRFSEGRAMQHVKALTDIGIRLAGHPEVDQAAQYLINEGEKLIRHAEQARPDLLVQISKESVSGAVETAFMHKEYTNFYNNLTNVVLVVSPRAGLREKSVLVNAHFDSTLGTTGASDDAACVGIILELARVLIANPQLKLAAPVVFLMNGAEEAFCPAAHGFMQQSPWAKDLGVFLNLESTGPAGPDFLFQSTGIWPMQVFATVAPFPRGSVIAQDFFELNLVPADTDNRMFSANLQGSLPGLDTAFLLDAGLYHTDRDNIDNLRPGTIQAMGQNALAVVEELGKQLALRSSKNITQLDAEKTIFFDVLGMFMVVYPFRWARLIHHAPLIITLCLPFLQQDAFPTRSLFGLYLALALETAAAIASVILAVLVSAFVAIFRVTSLGAPMAWYGHDAVPYMMLVPAATAGLLLPYLGRKVDPKTAALGNTLAFSLLASLLTSCGLGASYVGVIWAMAGLLTMTDLQQKPSTLLQWATINCAWPIIMMLPNAIALSLYVLQKTSFMGAQGQPHLTLVVADGIAGAVIGLVVVSVSGFLTPWVAYACGKGLRRAVLLLLCLSAIFAVQASLGLSPYTARSPKKVIVQHLHEHDDSGTVTRSVFAVGAVDSVPVDGLLQDRDSDIWAAKSSGWEWQTLYPLNEEFVHSRILQAPSPYEQLTLPSMELLGREQLGGGKQRLQLQMHLPGPGYFGCLNISGPILEWSLPQPTLLELREEERLSHTRFVRFVGSGSEEHWHFWVELPADSSLLVRLSAAHPLANPAIEEFIAGWPDWAFVIRITSYASSWEF